MDTQQITGQLYQILANSIDPLEGKSKFFNITMGSKLSITSLPIDGADPLSVDQVKAQLNKVIQDSLLYHKELVATYHYNKLTIWDPSLFNQWKDYRWEIKPCKVEGIHRKVFIGTRQEV